MSYCILFFVSFSSWYLRTSFLFIFTYSFFIVLFLFFVFLPSFVVFFLLIMSLSIGPKTHLFQLKKSAQINPERPTGSSPIARHKAGLGLLACWPDPSFPHVVRARLVGLFPQLARPAGQAFFSSCWPVLLPGLRPFPSCMQ